MDQNSKDVQKKTFIIKASRKVFYEIEIEANSEQEAKNIADDYLNDCPNDYEINTSFIIIDSCDSL